MGAPAPFFVMHQIWQPGPWGEDLGRSMTSQELMALQEQRVQERQAIAAPPAPEPEPQPLRRRRAAADE